MNKKSLLLLIALLLQAQTYASNYCPAINDTSAITYYVVIVEHKKCGGSELCELFGEKIFLRGIKKDRNNTTYEILGLLPLNQKSSKKDIYDYIRSEIGTVSFDHMDISGICYYKTSNGSELTAEYIAGPLT